MDEKKNIATEEVIKLDDENLDKVTGGGNGLLFHCPICDHEITLNLGDYLYSSSFFCPLCKTRFGMKEQFYQADTMGKIKQILGEN